MRAVADLVECGKIRFVGVSNYSVARTRQCGDLRGLERSRAVIEALRQIATDHGATPSQIALHWLVSFHGDAVVAIPGATKTRHVEDNVGAMALELTPAELARIDEVSRPFL